MDCRVNPDFVPIKALYFLFMAAFACMIPYLPVYFVDLGLEVWQIGIMRGMEPVIVFLLSPVWGALSDKFGKHKPALVLALIGSATFYFSLIFVPLISNQFTATSLNAVSELDHGMNPKTDWTECTSSRGLVFPTTKSPDVCYELCDGAFQSSDALPDANYNYLCTRTASSWECLFCPPDDDAEQVTNSDLSGSTNSTVIMRVCMPQGPKLVTYSPHKGGASNRVIPEPDNCATTRTCQCDITENIRTPTSQRVKFSLCFLLVILSVVFNCNILAFLDAVLMQKLGPARRKDYGKHRMWGAVGWGVVAFLSGYANDLFTRMTNSTNTRYEPLFVIFLLCMLIAVVVAVGMKFPEHEKPQRMHQDLLQLVKRPAVILFLVILAVEGISFGMSLSYVLIFLTSVLQASHTLMGIALLVSTLTEIPILFTSGRIIKVIGYEGVVYTTLAAYALRYMGYAFITNPWWVLPFQALHGITFGLGWPGFTHFAITNAPKGMAATLQAIMLGVYIGVGVAIGNFFGGFIVEAIGFRNLFLVNVGLLVFTAFFFFIVNQCFIKRASTTVTDDEDTKPGIADNNKNGEAEEAKVNLNGQQLENKGAKNQAEGETMLNETDTSKV